MKSILSAGGNSVAGVMLAAAWSWLHLLPSRHRDKETPHPPVSQQHCARRLHFYHGVRMECSAKWIVEYNLPHDRRCFSFPYSVPTLTNVNTSFVTVKVGSYRVSQQLYQHYQQTHSQCNIYYIQDPVKMRSGENSELLSQSSLFVGPSSEGNHQ